MFHRFTSLFYGGSENICIEGPDPSLTEKEDDGWLIVDFPDDCSKYSSGEVEVKASTCVPSPRLSDDHLPLASSSLESLCHCGISSRPPRSKACTLEESWFVTPPPCFTAEGQEPGEVEISPLENLLIEHPSMSVYAGSNTNISTVEEEPSETPSSRFETARPRSETENTLLLLFTQQGRNVRQPRAERPTAPSPAVAAGIQSSLVEKVSQARRLQRAKQRMERHQLSRNHIQRQNLTRECRIHRTKHHGSFVYQPRQRHYNY